MGSLIRFLRHLRDDRHLSVDEINRRYVYLTAGAYGPCRFGMYEAEFRLALRNSGFDGFRVILFQQRDGFSQSGPEAGLQFNLEYFLGLTNGLVMGDWLQTAAYRIRPYECDPGHTDRVVKQALDDLRRALLAKPLLPLRDMGLGRLAGLCPGLGRVSGPLRRYLDQVLSDHYAQAMRRAAERLDAIACDPLRVRPVVKITGEFWAQTTEGDGNFGMHRFLEGEGAEVLPEPVATWLDYLLHQDTQMLRARRDLSGPAHPWLTRQLQRVARVASYPCRYARLALADWLLHRECRRLRRPLRAAVHPMPDQAELRRLAQPFYDARLRGGEGHLEVGKSIYYSTRRLCHMVLSLKPFGCLPSTQSDGVQAAVVSRYPEILFLPVETSGEGRIHAYSRVQMALGDAREAARQEFGAALHHTGYSLTEVEHYLHRHPELARPLCPVPHSRGVAGRAAGLVLHVARRMRAEGIAPRRRTRVVLARRRRAAKPVPDRAMGLGGTR